jgi:CRISPR-associated protein Cmr4
LDNGESQNLWYEEFVPRESVFGIIILSPDKDGMFDTFKEKLHNKVVQLGGNATVGYGLCLFTYISKAK